MPTQNSSSPATQPSQENARRFAWLKRSGIFSGDLKGCTIDRARSLADLRDAYRLVHQVFLSSGYLKPEAGNIRLRVFEASAETATFIARHEGHVVAVLSVVGDSSGLGLPSDISFRPELDALRAQGLRLFELTNQAVDESFRRSPIATELMRCAIAHALLAGYDLGVAAVSPGHSGFYHMVGFTDVGSERSYSDKLHDPVVALGLDLNRFRSATPAASEDPVGAFVHAELADRNRFRDLVGPWSDEARQMFLTESTLVGLFVDERNLISELSPEARLELEALWGAALYGRIARRALPHDPAPVGRSSVATPSSRYLAVPAYLARFANAMPTPEAPAQESARLLQSTAPRRAPRKTLPLPGVPLHRLMWTNQHPGPRPRRSP